MTKGQLFDTMRYLGYTTHLEDGTPNPVAGAVADELAGKLVECVMVPTMIGECWAKHSPHKPTIGDRDKYLAHVERDLS